MKNVKEPPLRVYWDNCVWFCALELGNDGPGEQEKREFLAQHVIPSVEIGGVGVIFSPCLYADTPRNITLSEFEAKLKPFEDAGYITIAERTGDWHALARLRDDMRADIRNDPAAFAHVTKKEVALGDTTSVFAAIRTNVSELWTYDPLLLAFSGRSAVRGLVICEPRALQAQGILPLAE